MDPEVIAKLDEVRKMKGMTPRAVSDEETLHLSRCSSPFEPVQCAVLSPRLHCSYGPMVLWSYPLLRALGILMSHHRYGTRGDLREALLLDDQ